MPRYVLTGAPGSGKTALLRQLEIDGHTVVEEAATDVIALAHALGCDEPWREPDFVDRIVALQRQRLDGLRVGRHATVFLDRSPVCALALSRHLGRGATPLLLREVDRMRTELEPMVFFVRNQGFVRPTAARRISFADSLAFERLHEQAYRELGFRLIEISAGPLADRVALVEQALSRP